MFRYPEFLSQTELVTLSSDRHIKVILKYACAHELGDYGSIHRPVQINLSQMESQPQEGEVDLMPNQEAISN